MDADSDTKRKAYEVLQKDLEGRVTTWADIYSLFHEKMRLFQEHQEPTRALEALYHMYAFILALEALPEEGNIKVIVERMARIMAFESREKLGAEMVTITPEDIRTTATVLAAFGAQSLTERGHPEAEPENKTETKRNLH